MASPGQDQRIDVHEALEATFDAMFNIKSESSGNHNHTHAISRFKFWESWPFHSIVLACFAACCSRVLIVNTIGQKLSLHSKNASSDFHVTCHITAVQVSWSAGVFDASAVALQALGSQDPS